VLELDYVIAIHDEILRDFGGLSGYASIDRIQAALNRVETHAYYAGIEDVFGIAAMYTVAIARGHVFSDANKRTALTCALTYLEKQDIFIPRTRELENVVVQVAEGEVDQEPFAAYLSALWVINKSDI